MWFFRFLTGARAIETHIYGYNTYPDQLLTPATVLWHAETVTSSTPKAQTSADDGSEGKGKGKEKATATTSSNPEHKIRTVWIRVHPAATAEAHRALRHAASFAIDSAKQGGRTVEVEMADLREQFNVFEIMGPKASQVLKGALKPVDDNREDFKKVRVFGGRMSSSTQESALVLVLPEQDTVCGICAKRHGDWIYGARSTIKVSFFGAHQLKTILKFNVAAFRQRT